MFVVDSKGELRYDHKIIGDMVEEETRVLDMGCGTGELLQYLVEKKRVKGHGVEISEEAIYSCVEKGLSVSHGDIDSGLKEYPEKFFDYVILNQVMPQVHKPKEAILESLRIGKHVIVGFPNFCYIKARFQIFFGGHVPITKSLPSTWYNTSNLHFLSIKDFENFCCDQKIKVTRKICIENNRVVGFMPNLFALNAIFEITV
ncbi:Methionine biosynthesis MetW [Candidatus Omnitrophus magneticus]|uniref:Methionine biosynthesis MetW n=1 Tax=Candidatus Omnitrophus magneticus TaxID=1609969 RepID=A0A0F0CRQ9_9BACT|nr:Methionine biosynthesis MetW [Candidatus Omnitrophus magneticus]